VSLFLGFLLDRLFLPWNFLDILKFKSNQVLSELKIS
jgi:hypothetical protein